jgi:F-type H+-transporting ATPase subunit epsilon
MILEIITPDVKAYEAEVTLVKVPGNGGSFEILNNHAPVVAALDAGNVRIIDADKKVVNFQISGGIVEVQKNKVIILAESANHAA